MAGKLGRKRKHWQVVNQPLYNAIVNKYGEALAPFAADIGKSERMVQKYLYEGVIPRKKTIATIEQILGPGVI